MNLRHVACYKIGSRPTYALHATKNGVLAMSELSLFSAFPQFVSVSRVDVTSPQQTTLHVATQSDAQLLSNLLELYIHDVCAVFPSVELGPDGRFGYPKLPLYWSDPKHRFAYLVRHQGRVAGFVLATLGSPVTADPDVFDVAEFFVMQKYRRLGVGRQAAFLLWKCLPGKWTVRVSEGNEAAVTFWTNTVGKFTNGTAAQDTRPGEPNPWRVFSFEAH